MDAEELIAKASEYLPQENLSLVKEAYQVSLDARKPDLDQALDIFAQVGREVDVMK